MLPSWASRQMLGFQKGQDPSPVHCLMSVILALTLEVLGQEDHELQPSLVYTVRPPSPYEKCETQVLRVLYQPRKGKWEESGCIELLHTPEVQAL